MRLAGAEQLTGRRGQSAPQALDDHLLVLGAWIEWWRDLWLERVGLPERIVHTTLRERVRSQAARYAPEELGRFLQRLQRTRSRLRDGVNARLALEAMLLGIPPSVRSADNGA